MGAQLTETIELGANHTALNYTDGEEHLYRIARLGNALFTSADEINRAVLPYTQHGFSNNSLSADPTTKLWALERFFKYFHPELAQRIVAVRLRLNNYAQDLGLGVVSVSIEPLDDAGNLVLTPDDLEDKGPTVGSILASAPTHPQVLAGFRIHKGAEQFNADGNVYGRTFSHNEGPFPSVPGREPDRFRSGNGAAVITQGSTIGVSIPVLDPAKFKKSGLPYQPLELDEFERDPKSQIYTCRYLTMEAALRIIEEQQRQKR